MKGRCIGVSLLDNSSQYNKIKKSLPRAKAFLYYFRKNGNRETPQCTGLKGSLTMEAAIILPLFACFFSFLLFYFRIMQVQLTVQNALEETGRTLAILSAEELENSEKNISYFALAKGMMYLKLQNDAEVKQYVSGGALGVSLLTSEFDGDYILLNANYVMRFPVKLFGNKDFLICQKARFRKWTGWRSVADGEERDIWIYLTEHGQVYHMRASCPYLDLSIQSIILAEVKEKRNYSGERYDECRVCENDENQMLRVYITNYGNKYHSTVDCSGLKRSIYQKRLSEVGGMRACSKCSK